MRRRRATLTAPKPLNAMTRRMHPFLQICSQKVPCCGRDTCCTHGWGILWEPAQKKASHRRYLQLWSGRESNPQGRSDSPVPWPFGYRPTRWESGSHLAGEGRFAF